MKQIVDPRLLADLMELRKTNGAQLGRFAGTSRQFIHQLLKGRRSSCSDETAVLIEKALRVKRGVIFRDVDAEIRVQRRPAA